MQTQVTLRLSDRLYRSATRLAVGVKRPVRAVLTDRLALLAATREQVAVVSTEGDPPAAPLAPDP